MTTSTSSTLPSMPRVGTATGQLERIVVAVPDPAATAAFLHDGLHFDIAEQDGRPLVICEGEHYATRGQGAIELRQGPELAVQRLVFALPDDVDLDELARHVAGKQISDTAVEVNDPAGVAIWLELESTLEAPAPGASALRPRRMGHVNLKSPRPADSAAFYTEVLGLKLSEYIGENLFWMRTDTEHHNVALRPGRDATVHHLGFEVAGWHAYQPLMDHLDSRGFKVEYGPGRHRPGRSLFVYVCDPASGLRLELYADMVHINDPRTPATGWEPGDRLTTTLNAWGPAPPESFLA